MNEAPVTYVALGDSTGVGIGADDGRGGYPDRLQRRAEAAGFSVELANECRSGARSPDLPGGILAAAVHRKPQLATVGIGTNDIWRLIPVTDFTQNLTTVTTALLDVGARVIVCNIPDLALTPAAEIAQSWLGLSPAQITARIREFNREIAALSERLQFTVVDVFDFSQRELGTRPEFVCSDGFHPSSLGYERWTDLMWTPFLEALSANTKA